MMNDEKYTAVVLLYVYVVGKMSIKYRSSIYDRVHVKKIKIRLRKHLKAFLCPFAC